MGSSPNTFFRVQNQTLQQAKRASLSGCLRANEELHVCSSESVSLLFCFNSTLILLSYFWLLPVSSSPSLKTFFFPGALRQWRKYKSYLSLVKNHIPRIRIRSWTIVIVTHGFQGFRSNQTGGWGHSAQWLTLRHRSVGNILASEERACFS